MTAHELARLLLAGPDMPVVTPRGEDYDYYEARSITRLTRRDLKERWGDPWWNDCKRERRTDDAVVIT